MPIMASAGSKREFEPCPAGPQVAVCCDVVDLGIVEVTFSGETKRQHKVEIRWQSAELREDGKPFLVRERFTLSLHEKSKLRPFLEAWRGRKFTDEEAEGFDLERLIGVAGYINVVHRQGSKGGTFANVASIMPLPKAMQAPTISDYTRVSERPPVAREPQDEYRSDPPPPEDDFSVPVDDDDLPF